MGFWSRTFTWWNGATWGTGLWTRLHGEEVGRDDAGNIYYRDKKNPGRRWVIYAGANDVSRVPPEWYAWLTRQIEDLPDRALPPPPKFLKPPVPNLTGTPAAYRPSGSTLAQGRRPRATGDYRPWRPGEH